MKKPKVTIYVIHIYCAACGAFLYKYGKDAKGKLVKCYKENIIEDKTKGDLKCPNCGVLFARHAMIHGKPAHKIIQGKVQVRGNYQK